MEISERRLNKYDVLSRIVSVIKALSENQRSILLKRLLKKKAGKYLLKKVIDLPFEQQLLFLNKLENAVAQIGITDKRQHPRKACLINVNVSLPTPIYSSYILDINQHGAYIESNDSYSIGRDVVLMFSSPDSGEPIQVVGKIIWIDKQGAGVKFNNLNNEQLELIKSFSDLDEKVYEISS